MTNTAPDTKRPRTWRYWLGSAALALLGLAVVGALYLWWRLEWEAADGRKALAAALAAADESDPGWHWDEIEAARPAVPDGENSALVLLRLKDMLGSWRPGHVRMPDIPGPGPGLAVPGDRLLDERLPPNRRLDAQRLAILRAELGRREEVVALAASLKNYPRGRAQLQLANNVIGTLVPHAVFADEAVQLLELDCERLLHSGRAGDVPGRVVAALHAGACTRGDPFLVCALGRMKARGTAVRCVERWLGMAEPNDGACRALSQALAAELAEGLVLPALRGERATFHRLYTNLTTGKLPLADFLSVAAWGKFSVPDQITLSLYSYRLPADYAYLLARHNRLCEIVRLPDHEQLAASEAFDAESEAAQREEELAGRRRLLARLLVPGARKVAAASLRDRARLACAVAALAVERHRLAKKEWPASLAELVPGLLKEVPADPYTGGPVRYTRGEEGVIISCAGEGGAAGAEVLGGEGGDDEGVAVRLYDPERRGLPPAG